MLLLISMLACKTDDAGSPRGATEPDPAVDTSDSCESDADFFAAAVAPVLESDCMLCHVSGGIAAEARYTLDPGDDQGNLAALAAVAAEEVDGMSLLLAKPLNRVNHEGGLRFSEGSAEHGVFRELVARYAEPGGCGPDLRICPSDERWPGAQPLRRLSEPQLQNAFAELLGVSLADGVLPPTDSAVGFSTWPEANTVSEAVAEALMGAAEDASAAALTDPVALLGCDPVTDACAEDWALDFARRAFRRPLDSSEADRIRGLLAAGEDTTDGLRHAIEATLQSPSFLYLVASGASDGSAVVMDDHAVAARLAAFLWNSVPDAALQELADAGQLQTRAQVRAVAREMVDDPRAVDTVLQFHRDWLQLWRLAEAVKDAERYPEFSEALVADMQTELDLFVSEVVWAADGSVASLLWSPVSWTTPALEDLYGVSPERAGDGWVRTTLDASTRPGVLSRAGWLTGFAYTASSSPVKRGVFVLEELLCETLEAPADIDMDLEAPEAGETVRDTLAAHRADPSCAGCHDRIDPVGLSMEHYGGLGEHREVWDNGIAVDASGALDDPAGSFNDLHEMLSLIDAEERVRSCYARRWFEYAVGRPATGGDDCNLSEIQDRFAEADGDIRELMVSIAASDAFRIATLPEDAR